MKLSVCVCGGGGECLSASVLAELIVVIQTEVSKIQL